MSKPILLFLHGFTGSRADWKPMHKLFPAFETVAIDLPGHGDNRTPAPYTMAQAAAEIIAQMEKVRLGSRPFHLLGYSMGGRLALYTALHYPHSILSLTLESASPGLQDETARQQRRQHDNALADRIERDGLPAFVDFWEKLSLWDSQQQLADETRAALRQRRLQNDPAQLADSLRCIGTGAQPSLWPHLGELTMPVHLIIGAFDHKFIAIAQEMRRAMEEAQLDIVEGAGHTVHLERPLHFAKLINEAQHTN